MSTPNMNPIPDPALNVGPVPVPIQTPIQNPTPKEPTDVVVTPKVWWQSKTLWISIAQIVVGVITHTMSGGSVASAVGDVLVGTGALNGGLRLTTKAPIKLS